MPIDRLADVGIDRVNDFDVILASETDEDRADLVEASRGAAR